MEQATLHGEKCARVIACVNHDPNAIKSHAANHPETHHLTEDIRTLDMAPLASIVTKARKDYPNAKVVLWASLECTNFSKAKGGQPRDADSRTIANHLFRYIEAIVPDYIQIENVEEFMSWGEVDENGKPISKLSGTDYVRWCNRVQSYGYTYVWHILNAADYGAYTSRKRFFGQFAKQGLPHAFPTPTYSKDGASADNLFGLGLHRYKAVRDVLDLDDDGESIFGRKRPLVEATLIRIYAGLVKFVAGGKDAFLVKWNSMGQNGRYNPPSVDEPSPTVAVQGRLGVAKAHYLSKQFSGNGSSIDGVSPAIMPSPKQKLVTAFLLNPQYQSNGGSIDKPCFTLIARMDKMPPYLIQTEDGIGIEVYNTDSHMTRKIKEFMAMYGIIDIKMRMLKISELKAIMGFPADYVLVGTQGEQKKFIGNAVEVNQSRVLCEALAKKLEESSSVL